MKKIILILAIFTLAISCGQNKKSALNPTVYCVYTNDNNSHVFRGCAEGKDAMQQKTIELRNQGYTLISSTEKSSCSECH